MGQQKRHHWERVRNVNPRSRPALLSPKFRTRPGNLHLRSIPSPSLAPGSSDADIGLDLSTPMPGIAKLQACLGAQQVGIDTNFRNSVCFHFSKGADFSGDSIGFDLDLIKMPSCSESSKSLPCNSLRCLEGSGSRDSSRRSSQKPPLSPASDSLTQLSLPYTPGKIKSLSRALNLTAAISCKPQLPLKGRCRHLDHKAAASPSNVTSDVLLSELVALQSPKGRFQKQTLSSGKKKKLWQNPNHSSLRNSNHFKITKRKCRCSCPGGCSDGKEWERIGGQSQPLSTYCVPRTVLGSWDTHTNKTRQGACSHGTLRGETTGPNASLSV